MASRKRLAKCEFVDEESRSCCLLLALTLSCCWELSLLCKVLVLSVLYLAGVSDSVENHNSGTGNVVNYFV